VARHERYPGIDNLVKKRGYTEQEIYQELDKDSANNMSSSAKYTVDEYDISTSLKEDIEDKIAPRNEKREKLLTK
jgi:hypothetical protein